MESTCVPCLTWVKRGASKQHLEKVKHTKEELQEIIKEMKLKEAEYHGRPTTESNENNANSSDSDEDKNEVDDYYGMDNYDDDVEDSSFAGIDQGVERLLLNNVPETDSEDSDAEPEEFTVKPDDNLILAGHIDKDIPMLEVMVFNHAKEEFFILHDILLPSFPFAIEWLDFNPSDAENKGSFAAIGGINPEIDIWDLNVRGSLEPFLKLGKKKKNQHHTDAVLDLSWNHITRNILASGSADHTVLVWDLVQKTPKMRLTYFEEKVQSLQWHSTESHNLLVGSCEGKARLFDCRGSSFKTWIFDGEIERVLWNDNNPFQFYSTTDKGLVHLVDVRQTKPLWSLKAHEKEVTGITACEQCPDLMATASMDETVKIWDVKGSPDSQPTLVCQKFMNIGPIFTLNKCPDVPYVFCAGGSKKDNYLYLWDARDNDAVLNRFVNTKKGVANSAEKGTMDVEENPQPGTSSSNPRAFGNSLGGITLKKSPPKKKSKLPDAKLSSKQGRKKLKKKSHKDLHPKTRKDPESSDDE